MASPLPNTKAPAFVKNQRIWPRISGVTATPGMPRAGRRRNAGGACTTMATTPHRTNSQPISVSVHAVVTAMIAKIVHCRRSFAIVSLASL